MIWYIIVISIYVLGVLTLFLYDALIGIDDDAQWSTPNDLAFPIIIWPITLVLIITIGPLALFAEYIAKIKSN